MKIIKSDFRTDFCDELIQKEHKDDTYTYIQKIKNNCKLTHISIKKKENVLQKEIGEYITIDFDNIFDRKRRIKIIEVLKDALCQMNISSFRKVLVVGLGNEEVICDALGPKSCKKILVTSHLYKEKVNEYLDGTNNVAVFTPKVMGQTGIESAQMVQSIATYFHPDLIIVIDALATSSLSRINRAIQINNIGIKPGSGIGNHRQEITSASMGCPVIAIGVATVISLYCLLEDVLKDSDTISIKEKTNLDMVVTPKDMDDVLYHLSEIIGEGINSFVHPSYKDL